MIVGSTDFTTGNHELTIYEGVNDSLTFYAGATKIYDFKIPAGNYTRKDLIDYVNNFLSSKGEVDIRAEKFGEQYIAITSDKYVITGLSGNMIEIDGISSFLYDISNPGTITKSNGVYYGSAYLGSTATTFEKDVNDTFIIRLNNKLSDLTISLLNEDEQSASLTSDEIISRINAQFEELGLHATATMSGNRLKIESEYYGNGSLVTIDNSSPAYASLFMREETHYYEPNNHPGRLVGASLNGNYRDRLHTVIDENNDVLVIHVNGVDIELNLDMGEYGIDELIAHLNEKLPEHTNARFTYSASGGKQAIHLQSAVAGASIAFTAATIDSSAFETLFGGTRMITPTYTSGTTSAPIPPPEGTVGEAQINETAAVVTGRVNVDNGIVVADGGNQLHFELNEQSVTVELAPGTYSKESLLETLTAKLSGKGVSVEIRNGYLTLISEEKGPHVSFSKATGIGMERFDNMQPGQQSSTVSETSPSVTSVSQLKQGTVEIDSTNNNIVFTYVDHSGAHTVNLTIPTGTYTTRANFVAAMNDELKLSVLHNSNVLFTIIDDKLQLRSTDVGSGYRFSDLEGNLYEEFFKRRDFTFDGYGYTGTTYREGETYILGRQPLGNTIEIFPNVNEVLTFDIYKDNTIYTLDVVVPPNTYTRQSFIAAFNTNLKESLQNAGLPMDLMQAQIGLDNDKPPKEYDKSDKFVLRFIEHNDGRNDSGAYQIQGVRGTAAYTYFYNAYGEPKPSHVVGITDLSEGAVIEAGVNDEFSLDIDEVTKQFIIPAGNHTQDELLVKLNQLLDSENTGLIASYDNNRLKFSNREYGAIPIDGFAGSARDFLFFRTERRETQEEMKFQVGANQGQSINYNRVRLSDQLLRINTLTISHRHGADNALGRLDLAINMLTDKSGYVGAIENRLQHIIKVNEINMENLVSAESRIRDADLAKEMMTQVMNSILLQTNQAMIMHAKALPEGVLQLLRN